MLWVEPNTWRMTQEQFAHFTNPRRPGGYFWMAQQIARFGKPRVRVPYNKEPTNG